MVLLLERQEGQQVHALVLGLLQQRVDPAMAARMPRLAALNLRIEGCSRTAAPTRQNGLGTFAT